jgi:hypothetical protein
MYRAPTIVLMLTLIAVCHEFAPAQNAATPTQTAVANEQASSPAVDKPPSSMTSNTNRARWMQDRLGSLGDRPLKNLVLPASHDSAMYKTVFPQSLGQTQDLTIYEQLSNGIRYFDLRPLWDDAQLFIHHGPVKGPKLSEMLDDVRRFASEGHRELVILKFSHYEGFHDEAYVSLAKQIKASLDPWLYKSLPRGKRLADISLSDYVRHSSAILVLSDGGYPLSNPREGIWVYRDWESEHPEQGDLRVYDQYSNTVSFPLMKTDQFDKFNRYDGKCKTHADVPCDLFLLSWTLTPPTDVRSFAAEANRNLASALKDLKIPNRFGCVVNLIYADYVNYAKVADLAIEQNETISSAVVREKK